MIPRRGYELPEEQQRELEHGRKLARWSLFWLTTIAVVMYFTMGSSQAMKTAWVEDVLSMIPPLVFLLASKREQKPPRERFPYGHYRLSALAFLAASTALAFVGLFLLYESLHTLIAGEHPTLGAMHLFGYTVWSGWLMIAALAYSVVPAVILARKKKPVAKKLHHKVLYADAAMNQADWTTGVAGILGILGVGMGFWWADSVAAGIISLDVTKDGLTHLKQSVAQLMDSQPLRIGTDEADPLDEELRQALCDLPWVEEADVRLREVGALLAGEAYLVVKDGTPDLLARLQEAARVPRGVHWRLYDVVPTVVESLEKIRHPEKGAEQGKR